LNGGDIKAAQYGKTERQEGGRGGETEEDSQAPSKEDTHSPWQTGCENPQD
jgi:hypothetical protein